MNFVGILIAACSFWVIGVFHPIVIKCEYHFSKKVWPYFLAAGLLLLAASLLVQNTIVSCLLASWGAVAFGASVS